MASGIGLNPVAPVSVEAVACLAPSATGFQFAERSISKEAKGDDDSADAEED